MTNSEVMIWRGKPSHIGFLWLYFSQWLIFIGACYIAFNISPSPFLLFQYGIEHRQFSQVWLLNAASLFVMIASLLWFIWTVICVFCLRYTLTNQQLLIRSLHLTGLRRDEIELYRIIEYILLRPFHLIPFNLGNIVLYSNDVSKPRCEIIGINNPRKLLGEIRIHVEEMRDKRHVTDLNLH